MKSIPYTVALARAEAASAIDELHLLAACRSGDRSARSYLRALYTTSKEYNQRNPPPLPDEDGPCAGWGCEATIIY